MGLKNNRKMIIHCLVLIVVLLVQLVGSMLYDQINNTNYIPALVECTDVIYDDPPSINHVPVKSLDIACVNDLILTTGTQMPLTLRNISKINNRREFTREFLQEFSYTSALFNNGNHTFIRQNDFHSSNRSDIGIFENNNISNFRWFIGTSLSGIHEMAQLGNNLYLFGIESGGPYCEIYDISDINKPLLVNDCNLSEIDIFTFYPEHYEYVLYLDYQFHENYLYHSTINNKLLVYDFKNTSAPVKVKEFAKNYSRVIFQEELMYGLTETKLEIFNNTNPLQPKYIASYDVNTPKALTVKGNVIFVITERELIILSKMGEQIDFINKYTLKEMVSSRFYRIFLHDNYALVLTTGYTTGSPDTQSDLFIFDISNINKIDLLYPKIKLPYNVQIILFGIAQYGVIFIIIIFSIVLGLKIIGKLERKTKAKKVKKQP
ncbi:MAG: hypothetical protein ACTSPM_00140 [Candidatus Heimdallarchaeota archaeon]